MRRSAFLAAASLAAGLLAGCATPAAPAPRAEVHQPGAQVPLGVAYSPVTLDPLKKGMTTAEVIALWGQPEKLQHMHHDAGAADIWTYHHVISSYQRQVATSTQLVPVFDSFTNGTKNVPEAVYSQERVQITQTAELLIFKERLIEWKVIDESSKMLLN
jgi:outer membrane protein assembly factor BamE (lipoprotein component of BamABCDE complex)